MSELPLVNGDYRQHSVAETEVSSVILDSLSNPICCNYSFNQPQLSWMADALPTDPKQTVWVPQATSRGTRGP